MLRHFKIMLRHKTKLKGKALSRQRNFMLRNFSRAARNEKFVATKFLCRDNYYTTSAELCRNIFKLCSDGIQEGSTKPCRDRRLQAKTKAREQI